VEAVEQNVEQIAPIASLVGAEPPSPLADGAVADQIGDAAGALVADDGGEAIVMAAAATSGVIARPPAEVGAATDGRDLSEVAQAPSSAAETMLPTTGPVDAGAGPQLNAASGSPQPVTTNVSLQSEGAAGSAQPLPSDIRPQPALVGMNAQPVGGGVSIQPDRADMRPQGTWAGAVVEPDRPTARSQRDRAGVQQIADTQVGAQAPESAGSAAAATQGAVGSAPPATQAGVVSAQDVANVAADSKLDLATASQDPLFATIFLFAQQQTAGANGDPTSSDPETAGVQTAAIATDRASIHVLVLPALEQIVTAIAAFIPSTGGPGVAVLLIGLTALGGVGVWLRRVGRRRS